MGAGGGEDRRGVVRDDERAREVVAEHHRDHQPEVATHLPWLSGEQSPQLVAGGAVAAPGPLVGRGCQREGAV